MPAPAMKPLILLGYDAIDQDHGEFVELVREAVSGDNVAFTSTFRALLAHTHEHFGRENALMLSHGFPALAEHLGEHKRVLGELTQFLPRVERGCFDFGRAFVVEQLVPWFERHVATMDRALVTHLKTRRA